MEQNFHSPAFEELNVTPSLDQSFAQASTWSRIVAIISIVVMGLLILFAFVSGSLLSRFLTTDEMPAGSSGIITGIVVVVVLFVCAVGGVLVYFLLRFATRTREGIRTGNQYRFNEGLAALKNFFIMYGVLGILSLFFSALSLFTLL